MAILPDADRFDAWRRWMRDNTENCGFTKAELRAALDATDDWIEANQASFVQALPTAFRTASTTAQKVRLFTYVTRKRFLG